MNTIGNAEESWLFLISLAFSSLLLLIQLGELGGFSDHLLLTFSLSRTCSKDVYLHGASNSSYFGSENCSIQVFFLLLDEVLHYSVP